MKRLLFVVDSETWTLGHIAKQIKDNLSTDFDIDIVTLSMFNDNLVKVLILSKNYDLTHFFWRGQLLWLREENTLDYVETLGLKYDDFIKKYVNDNNITTSVCDHLYLTDNEIDNTKYMLSNVKNYIVINKILYDIYSKIEGISKPYGIIHDGVDLSRFNVKSKKDNKMFTIGWAGNSKFTDSDNDDDLKGVNKIIMPAFNELKDEGYEIEMNIADRNTNYIPFEKMPDYYNSLDLYVCASKTEGTPAPILEAMACGVPVISTNVGVVDELFGDNQKEYIMKERSKQCLKENIVKMINNKNDLKKVIDEGLENVKAYDWKNISLQYKEFFEYCLENN